MEDKNPWNSQWKHCLNILNLNNRTWHNMYISEHVDIENDPPFLGKGEKERHIVLIDLRRLSPIVVPRTFPPIAGRPGKGKNWEWAGCCACRFAALFLVAHSTYTNSRYISDWYAGDHANDRSTRVPSHHSTAGRESDELSDLVPSHPTSKSCLIYNVAVRFYFLELVLVQSDNLLPCQK